MLKYVFKICFGEHIGPSFDFIKSQRGRWNGSILIHFEINLGGTPVSMCKETNIIIRDFSWFQFLALRFHSPASTGLSPATADAIR